VNNVVHIRIVAGVWCLKDFTVPGPEKPLIFPMIGWMVEREFIEQDRLAY
jgi:hypothetical protein